MKFVDVTTLTQEAVAQTLGTTYLTKDGKIASIESFKLVSSFKYPCDCPKWPKSASNVL